MSIREEQCDKVCRILDDVLANRPTERDSLIVAVRKAFEAIKLFGNSEPLPSAQSGLDEWCTDCKEYDKERHCCPRWNRVIRETVEEWKSNQPEIIHCGDCRHWKNNHLCECLSRYGTFETEICFYCGFAEKRDE